MMWVLHDLQIGRVGTFFVPTLKIKVMRGHKKMCPPYGITDRY